MMLLSFYKQGACDRQYYGNVVFACYIGGLFMS